MKSFLLFLKGMAMGSADVVPGISGGTVAFITGIYSELIQSLSQFNWQTLKILIQQGPIAAWKAINGGFLLTLLTGIMVAIVSLANVVHYLLDHFPVLLWSFFFGLVIGSIWLISRQIPQWRIHYVVLFLIGFGLAAGISLLSPMTVEPTPLLLFFAGSIAICAMLLPGISGSFILLMMGLYEPVILAIKEFDLVLIAIFGGGAIFGLLIFSQLLNWLLQNAFQLTLALLTGVLAGSLVKIWPWKETLTYRLNSAGEQVAFLEKNVIPSVDVSNMMALLIATTGLSLVLLFSRFQQSN